MSEENKRVVRLFVGFPSSMYGWTGVFSQEKGRLVLFFPINEIENALRALHDDVGHCYS